MFCSIQLLWTRLALMRMATTWPVALMMAGYDSHWYQVSLLHLQQKAATAQACMHIHGASVPDSIVPPSPVFAHNHMTLKVWMIECSTVNPFGIEMFFRGSTAMPLPEDHSVSIVQPLLKVCTLVSALLVLLHDKMIGK